MLQQIKHSANTEIDSVCAVLYCELKDDSFAELSNKEASRLQQCVRGLKKISAGTIASSSVVKRALTDEQHDDYIKSFDVDFSHTESDERDDVPWQLREYIEKVRDGDKYTRTANMFKRSTKRDYKGHTAYQRYLNKAEGCYEDAVMLLINCIDLDTTRNPNADSKVTGEILRCLDRDVNPEPGSEPDASAQGVPRLRGTKSKYTQVDAAPVVGLRLRKYWRQREALTQAAVQMLYEEVEEDLSVSDLQSKMSSKLNKLLQLRDDDLF